MLCKGDTKLHNMQSELVNSIQAQDDLLKIFLLIYKALGNSNTCFANENFVLCFSTMNIKFFLMEPFFGMSKLF